MKSLMIALFLTVISGSAALAECNATCRVKCDATWRGYFPDARACYAKWGAVNKEFGTGASALEGKVGANTDLKKFHKNRP